jgi:hypothetical protein
MGRVGGFGGGVLGQLPLYHTKLTIDSQIAERQRIKKGEEMH